MAEHDYFGVIDETGAERWSETVEANDQSVQVSLWLGGPATDDALDRAAAMVMSLDAIDRHAREQLVAELASSGSSTSQFVARVIDELDDAELAAELKRSSGDHAIDILRSLSLDSVTLRPDLAGDDEAFCVFRYHFAPDVFDLVLVATLDARAESVGVTLETW